MYENSIQEYGISKRMRKQRKNEEKARAIETSAKLIYNT